MSDHTATVLRFPVERVTPPALEASLEEVDARLATIFRPFKMRALPPPPPDPRAA